MTEDQRRMARARLLRRQGKTYDEIRAVIGPVSDDSLKAWLRGIPRPPQTRRGRACGDLRRECRRLRARGFTYDEIAAKTGASTGSISPWVRDVVMPRPVGDDHRARVAEGRRRAGAKRSNLAAARRDDFRRRARMAFGSTTDRDLFVAGLALYWAEGSKDKPWRRNGRVVLINSDPGLVRLFLWWPDLLEVPRSARSYRLHIHETADVPAHETWWCDELGISRTAFARATIKRHNPRTVRKNVGESYHGCLIISVAASSGLYYSIEGWWSALTDEYIHAETCK